MKPNKGLESIIFSDVLFVEGLSKEVTFEQISKWSEEAIRIFLGRENSKCKGPEVDFLLCLRNVKGASVDGEQSARGRIVVNQV